MDINCLHFDFCSGCSRDKNIEHFKALHEAQQFFAECGISPLKLNVGTPTGWRCRAKLATRGTSAHPLIGLFEEGSHRVVDIPFCQVHHPAINRSVEALKAWIVTQGVELYDERTGAGFLRYVQLAVERKTRRVQMVLVVNEMLADWDATRQKAFLQGLWEQYPELWHSLWINFNKRRDNVIFTPHWQLVYGEKWLWEELCGRQVCFHPASFAQANLDMFERLLRRIADVVPEKSRLIEFYAGVGAIGLSLLDKCDSVCCSEVVPLAKECFDESVRHLPQELSRKISFVCGSSASHTHLLNEGAGVVLVDPPRKGLEPALLEALCQSVNVERLIYISCGWESFQRDCQKLIAGRWKIVQAEAFLFFPGSEHLETFAVFDR